MVRQSVEGTRKRVSLVAAYCIFCYIGIDACRDVPPASMNLTVRKLGTRTGRVDRNPISVEVRNRATTHECGTSFDQMPYIPFIVDIFDLSFATNFAIFLLNGPILIRAP